MKRLDSVFMNRSDFLGSVVFTIIFFLKVLFFYNIDCWNSYFFKISYLYLPYNFLRIVFLIYFALCLYTIGNLLLNYINNKLSTAFKLITPFEAIIINSYIGSACLAILFFLIGLLKGLYFIVGLIVITPIVFLSYKEFKNGLKSIFFSIRRNINILEERDKKIFLLLNTFLLFVLIVQIASLFISKGLMPDLITNDTVGHYIPYYQEVVNQHSIWMNKYWFHYYYSKGASLFFLATLLTDVQSTQLISFYFYFLSGLTLMALVGRCCKENKMVWVLLSGVIFFGNSMVMNEHGLVVMEFQKSHIIVGSIIVFVIFLLTLFIYKEKVFTNKQFFIIFSLMIIALTIVSAISAVFTLSLFILMLLFSYFLKLDNQHIFAYCALTIFACTISMMFFNLFTSGMAEATPLPLFFDYKVVNIMEKWISPFVIEMQIFMNTLSGEGVGGFSIPNMNRIVDTLLFIFYDRSMLPIIMYVLILISFILTINVNIILFKHFLPVIFMLIITTFIILTNTQHSLYRYAWFVIFLKSALYVMLFIHISDLFNKYRTVFLYISCSLILTFIIYSQLNISSSLFNISDKMGFLFGKYAYADLYEKKWGSALLGKSIKDVIPKDHKVLPLNFMPGLYGLPGGQFQRPLMNDLYRKEDFEKIIFGNVDEAKNAFLKNGITFFLLDFRNPFIFHVYTPLFEPLNFKKLFKVVGKGDGLLLLTLLDVGDKIDDNTFNTYTSLREIQKEWFMARSYYLMIEKYSFIKE